MAISAVNTVNNSGSISAIVSDAAAPLTRKNKTADDQQISSIVTLSAQARKLSLNDAQSNSAAPVRPDTQATESLESRAAETTESPSRQFSENETRGSRVNTYA